jgi:hypothetical protein
MRPLDIGQVTEFVEENITEFHEKKLQSLEKLDLKKLLKRKNPYLFRAKNILRASDLVDYLLNAYLSSSEEEIFGKRQSRHESTFSTMIGQRFWHFISGNPNLYTDIIEPIGHQARQHNERFLLQKEKLFNQALKNLLEEFCDDGVINWQKIVMFNSGNMR